MAEPGWRSQGDGVAQAVRRQWIRGNGSKERRRRRWSRQGGGPEPKPQTRLCLGGHGGGNDHGNCGHSDSQGFAAKAMATRAATEPSTVVAKAGTVVLDGWVRETNNATTIRRSRRLFLSYVYIHNKLYNISYDVYNT